MVAYGPVFPSMIGFLEFCVFYFCQGVETTESVYERRKHSKQDFGLLKLKLSFNFV